MAGSGEGLTRDGLIIAFMERRPCRLRGGTLSQALRDHGRTLGR